MDSPPTRGRRLSQNEGLVDHYNTYLFIFISTADIIEFAVECSAASITNKFIEINFNCIIDFFVVQNSLVRIFDFMVHESRTLHSDPNPTTLDLTRHDSRSIFSFSQFLNHVTSPLNDTTIGTLLLFVLLNTRTDFSGGAVVETTLVVVV